MTTDMGMTPPMDSTPSAGGQSNPNRQRNIIIAVVVVVILLCCCCVTLAGAYWIYQNEDTLLGQGQSHLLPLFLRL